MQTRCKPIFLGVDVTEQYRWALWAFSVTFVVEATAVSENERMGTANTTVKRSDDNLNIPSLPNVANVEEEVDLIIDFVARAEDSESVANTNHTATVANRATLMLAEGENYPNRSRGFPRE